MCLPDRSQTLPESPRCLSDASHKASIVLPDLRTGTFSSVLPTILFTRLHLHDSWAMASCHDSSRVLPHTRTLLGLTLDPLNL